MKKKWIYLILATILNVFSLGIMNVFVFAWVWPIFLLIFNRRSSFKETVLFTIASIMLSSLIKWIGVSNVNYALDIIYMIIFAVPVCLSFIIYKLIQDKFTGSITTLMFPLIWVSIDILMCFLPVANLSLMAYTQIRILPLIQFASVLGTHFISFIVIWFSSIIEYAINYQQKEKKIPGIAFIYILLVLCELVYGGVRINKSSKISLETVKVASCIGISNKDYDNGLLIIRDDVEYFEYLDQTVKDAYNVGAKILNYSEESLLINKTSKSTILSYASTLATAYDMYIVIPLDIYDSENPNSCLNELYVIDNFGNIQYEYQKQKLIPIVETTNYESSKQELKTIETKYGLLSTVICYDLDFPYFMNKVGKLHPDIVIAPSWDYPALQNFHTFNASFRAIENGFNLVRNTVNGVTIYFDAYGRKLTYYNSNSDGYDYMIIEDLPTVGKNTIYSYIGQYIDFIYPISLISICLYLIIDKKKNSAN